MSNDKLQITRQRYERKYLPETLSARDAKFSILSSRVVFKPLFYPRYINNIYLDTIRLDNYYDNVHGRSQRKKIRVRWYGDIIQSNIEPVLEIKIKSGHIGDKKLFKLPACDTRSIIESHQNIEKLFESANLPLEISQLVKNSIPRLLNRYKRTYFLDASGNFRMTVDENIKYQGLKSNFNFIINPVSLSKETVVELKYDSQFDSEAEYITENIPFRLTKNSKYVNGIEHFFNVRF